ncbi:MAG: hypothetical protein Q7J79_10670, partial [Gemmatimonadales bacterium]|nr:hypothetical protein [Gemmatimonadales bacterium]
MSVLRRWQYLAFLAPVVAAQVTACGGSTEPPPAATTIVATPSVVTLNALGETRQLTAKVLDQHVDSMPNASVTWSS